MHSRRLDQSSSLAGGKKITSSNPLAKAYKIFLNAMKRCDRNEMMKNVLSEMTQEMSTSAQNEFKHSCRGLEMILPRDFENASEVIDGDRGQIQ